MAVIQNNITLNLADILRYFTDKNKIILFISGIILLNLVVILPTSALSYQSTSQVEFTLNPTITISVSDLSIPSLSPGDSKDSNIINVVASSNATSGYALYSNVGSSNNSSTELRKDGTDTTHKFTSLLTSDSLPALVTDNTWGYSYSNDNGTTWTNYSGLPLYLDGNDKKLASDTTAGTTTISFKIAAKASTTLVAGEYTNTINFIGIANPNPSYITLDEATYMQDTFSCAATPVGTVKKLIDNRDGQEYLVARAMDGNCWMIENLKIGKTLTSDQSLTLTSSNSDVTDNFIMNYTDIPTDGKFHAYTIDDVPGQNNSNEWICRDDWDSCYYNWYTTTAGSGTSYVATGNVGTSICPAGWTLPTGESGGQFQTLYNQYDSTTLMLVDNPTTTKNNSAGKIPGFLLSGRYTTGGAEYLGSLGPYWSHTAIYNSACDLSMSIHSVTPSDSSRKYYGFAVRCLRSS